MLPAVFAVVGGAVADVETHDLDRCLAVRRMKRKSRREQEPRPKSGLGHRTFFEKGCHHREWWGFESVGIFWRSVFFKP